MGSETELLVIGIGGHAIAVDPATGAEVWRTALKGRDFVTVSPAGRRVFAGAGGELFCLDAATGQVLWHNRLKGLGMGLVTFTGSGDAAAAKVVAERRRAAAAAAATSS